MSQHSLLNIQEISSRTFNNDPSIMETSIEHFQRQNHANFTKHDLHNMSLKKTVHHGIEEVVRDLSFQNQGLKREVEVWKNRYIEMQRGNGGNLNHAQILKQLSQKLAVKDKQIQEKARAYNIAISNLQETIAKNQLLSDQVQRLTRKLKQSQLNYSREQQVYQKSQNLISNLSITKSNYEIELVNMKDSLIILEKENHQINQTNQQYEDKLAMISQEIERLNRKDQNAKKEKNQLEVKIKKYELEMIDQKNSLEKLRMENRDCNNKIAALSMQLREFHEQITYKETIISDFKDGQAKIERLLKEKEGYIKQLQGRMIEMQRFFKSKQEDFSKQRSSYSQEIGKLRSKISEQSSSTKQSAIRSENIQKQYQKLYQQNNYLKNELSKEINEKGALFQQFKSISSERDNLIRDKQELIRELDTISNQNRELNNQIQNLKSDILIWQEKYQKTEDDFRRYEENERALSNEYQTKITQINQQRLSELNGKVSELNQCKFELANRINEINQIKTEISIKSTELIRLKEDTTAQSNIFEYSRKDFDDKLRERIEMINDLKSRLANCEKMIDQNRRERDMLMQQNNSLINAKQKSQRAIQLKNQEINTSTGKIQELGRSLRDISSVQDKKYQELQNCKRIIRSNEDTIKDLNFKLVNGDNNMKNLSMELQRVVSMLKEKQAIVIDLTNKCKQYASTIEKGNLQVSNLKQNNQKMHMSLSYAQESNSNFQIFMKQIERLNQIVLGKDGEIKNLRGQLGRLIQKIDQISQQQLKIVKVLEATYQSSSQKDIDTNNQFTDLKDFISRLNENTNVTLKDLYSQSSNIINQLNQTENDTRQNSSKIQQKLMDVQRTVERKETEIILLKKEVTDLQIKIEQYNKSSVNQSQIFEKILQLSRQNAAVREQMIKMSSERDNEIENKNKNITYLQSQVKQLQVVQGKELAQLKLYLQEKQRIFEQKNIRFNEENAVLKQQIHQRDRLIAQYEDRINNISLQIDKKMKQMEKLQKELLQNARQLQAYKKTQHENYKSRELIGQIQVYQNQVSKLVKIIEIRQEQLAKNQESFEKLQKQNKKYKQKNMQLQLKCQQNTEQKFQLQQRLRESESINYHFQHMQAKTNNSSQSTRQVQALKEQNEALDRRLKQFYTKLRQNEGKLSMTQEQVSNLMQNLSKVGEIHSEINEIQTLHKKIHQLQQRNYQLQNQLEETSTNLNQQRIQNNYLIQDKEQNKIFLHSFEYKTAEIERQYKKLKEVYDNLSRQYSKLQMKNHEFEMQLKKAQILQQNIQVLKGQLNRLSMINIDLNQEVSSCKLALGDESTIQRRNAQLLTLIVILMAEIQSLRSRIAAKQIQLNNSRILHLGRSKS